MENEKKVAACITVAGPESRFTRGVLDTMIPALKAAAATISESLQKVHK